MLCNHTASCTSACRGMKGFLKRLGVIIAIQFLGWFTYTYVEEGFVLTDCIFNREKVRQIADRDTVNNTDKNSKLYLTLDYLLGGNLTDDNFVIYHDEFKNYFKVKDKIAKRVDLTEICMRWYLFTAISLTTVGYGNVVPKTRAGKIIFIPYCLIGIPVMLFFLSFIGGILTELCGGIVALLSNIINKTKGEVTHKELKTFIVAFIFLWLWIMIETLQNHFLAESPLTIVDAVYFYFVSFTTIGYGDITSPMNEIFFEFRLYIGLSLMSGNVNSFLKFYQMLKSKRAQKKGNCCCRGRKREADTEESVVIGNRAIEKELALYSTHKEE